MTELKINSKAHNKNIQIGLENKKYSILANLFGIRVFEQHGSSEVLAGVRIGLKKGVLGCIRVCLGYYE